MFNVRTALPSELHRLSQPIAPELLDTGTGLATSRGDGAPEFQRDVFDSRELAHTGLYDLIRKNRVPA